MERTNKMVFCRKTDLMKIYTCNLSDLESKKLPELIFELDTFNQIELKENIYQTISQYLSLFWKFSKLEYNESLRKSAEPIRNSLFNRCKNDGNNELINLYNIVGYVKPEVHYRLITPSEEELKLRKLTLEYPIDKILKDYPEYDIETLESFRAHEINAVLRDMETMPLLDFKSKIFLKSSNMIINLLQESDIDFSAVTIGYAKFFEREIDLSVVQLIRQQLGILMPKYYEKYCDLTGEYHVMDGRGFKVDFNMVDKRSNRYLPPGLGQSLKSFEIYSEEVKRRIEHNKLIINKGKSLNTIRNNSAHPELISLDDVKKVQEIIVDLFINKVFDDLHKIKKELTSRY